MNDEIEFSPEAMSSMMEVVNEIRKLGPNKFERLGAKHTRSFVAGMIAGIAIGEDIPYEIVYEMLVHPTVQSMLDGVDLVSQ